MPTAALTPADLRRILVIADRLSAPRPFAQQLTAMLAGACELTGARVAIAFEIEPRSPRVQIVRPLLEVVGVGAGQPRRSSLVGSASIADYTVASLRRATRTTTSFGRPAWGDREPLLAPLGDGRRVLHTIQFLADWPTAIAAILARPRAGPFRERDRQAVDTLWRSFRFQPRPLADGMIVA